MIKPLPQGKALEKGRMIPTERFAIVLPHPKQRSLSYILTKRDRLYLLEYINCSNIHACQENLSNFSPQQFVVLLHAILLHHCNLHLELPLHR